VACGGSSTAPTVPTTPTTPIRSPIGTWVGGLTSTSGGFLTATLIVARDGQSYSAICSQLAEGFQFTENLNQPVQSFGTFTVVDSPTEIGLHGLCNGKLFQVVYDPATDRVIDAIWVGGEYTGIMTRH
jgi:hypothetical protein